jgi:hypothetical protein
VADFVSIKLKVEARLQMPAPEKKDFEEEIASDARSVLLDLYIKIRQANPSMRPEHSHETDSTLDKILKSFEPTESNDHEMLGALKAGIISWLRDHQDDLKEKISPPLDVTLLRQPLSEQASIEGKRAWSEIDKDFRGFMLALSMYYAHGKRTQWARALGLEGLLVKFIPAGSILDQFSGFRSMSTQQIADACFDFFLEVVALLHNEQSKMSKPGGGVDGGGNDMEDLKFQSVPNAVYAKLDEFYRGPESRIGIPNPNLLPAMKAEHCFRSTANKPFVAPNYGLCTTSEIEWYWMNNPDLKLEHYNKTSQALLYKWTGKDGDKRPYLFPGEVDSEVFEIVLQVQMPVTILGKPKMTNTGEQDVFRNNEMQLWQQDVLERLSLIFAPESRFFQESTSNSSSKKGIVKNRLLQMKPVKTSHVDAKLVKMQVALSFLLQPSEKSWSDFQDRIKLLFLSANTHKLLSGVRVEQDPNSGNIVVLRLTFSGKTEIWKAMQINLGTSLKSGEDSTCAYVSSFIGELTLIRIHSLFEKSNKYKASSKPGMSDQKIVESNDAHLVTAGIVHPFEFNVKENLFQVGVSLSFEGSKEPNLDLTIFKDLWDELTFPLEEPFDDVEFIVLGSKFFQYCEKPDKDMVETKLKTADSSLPKLTVDSLQKTSLEALSQRLEEQGKSISELLNQLKMTHESRRQRQGRVRTSLIIGNVSLQDYLNSLLPALAGTKDTSKEISMAASILRKEEVIALRLYTGPIYVIYNALLRSFPSNVLAIFSSNRFESTIFAIISGIAKLSRHTQVPSNRRLYRGLAGVKPPPEFWGNKKRDQFLGVIEFGLQSTTESKDVAIQYTGNNEDIIIFEMQVGKIDVGASISFLSQYPGEKEFLMQPLTCLEVGSSPVHEINADKWLPCIAYNSKHFQIPTSDSQLH